MLRSKHSGPKIPFTLIENQDLQLLFNPFGGLMDEEIPAAISINVDLHEIASLLKKKEPIIIEFVGKQGRGKTTHLKFIHQHFATAPLLLTADKQSKKQHSLIFADSIHQFNFRERLAFYKRHQHIVLTTHHSRKWEYALAKKISKTFYFTGIDASKLQVILEKRIRLALRPNKDSNIDQKLNLNSLYIQQLIAYFGDDYRGILNFLYDEYQ